MLLYPSQNEVQTHINKDNGAQIPLFIQYDRKYTGESSITNTDRGIV